MPKLPVSVHVLAWNSAQTLEPALQSVRDCAEIMVIDGGSTDETIAIAERFGARVIPQRMPGGQGKPLRDFSAARNVGLMHATQPWILCLDSDEEMQPQAMEEISAIVRGGGPAVAYRVPRRYRLPTGAIVDRASTYPNERVYFFHRGAVEQWEKPVHERVIVKSDTEVLRLQHGSVAPLPPLPVFYGKLGQYLAIETAQSEGKGYLHWLTRRVLHTLKGRLVAALRLLWIWLLPHGGTRLPLSYEFARYWYAWRLMVDTFPMNSHA